MPRAQDFSQSTIYHIRYAETREVIYVGSSCAFATRVRGHKSKCNNAADPHYNLPVYQHIRGNGGWDAYQVVPVSHHNFQNKVELQILEQAEMDRYQTLKNAQYARRTPAEYYQANVASILECQAQYRQNNVASIAEQKAQYRQKKISQNCSTA